MLLSQHPCEADAIPVHSQVRQMLSQVCTQVSKRSLERLKVGSQSGPNEIETGDIVFGFLLATFSCIWNYYGRAFKARSRPPLGPLYQ